MVKNSNSGGRSYTPPSTTDFKSAFNTDHISKPDRALGNSEADKKAFVNTYHPGGRTLDDPTIEAPISTDVSLNEAFDAKIPTLNEGVNLETGEDYVVEVQRNSSLIDPYDPSAYDTSLLTPDHN